VFVAVRSYDNYISANLVLQQLEEANIRAWLQDEHTTVALGPILSNTIGGIKLMVFHSQVPRAQLLLKDIEQAYHESVKCPHCGSADIHFITQTSSIQANWFSSIASWLFGNYTVTVKQVYRCFGCNVEFDELPEQEAH
jgi:DNA-directed RNA polymerase subunit RPC12/RpoP